MTRINCVPPSELHDRFLVAEYHELPRIFSLVQKAIIRGEEAEQYARFDNYCMGTGHVKFFYTRLKWLAERQTALIEEMLKRGMRPNFRNFEELFKGIPRAWFGDWLPTEEAMTVNRSRLMERFQKMSAKPKRKVLSIYDLENERGSNGQKKSKISKAEELLKARESDKLKMMREYARLQKLRSTVGGSETKPKVTLPRFSWDEKNYDEGKRLDDRGDNLDGN